jgi:pseudouridine synthase
MRLRLQKYMADCQIASRRKAEEYISAGLVKVNGATVTELGTKIDPDSDTVEYCGSVIRPSEEKAYVMLHKPDGYITSAKDQFGRPDVSQLVADIPARLYPVGRLDYDTSGLLLMTNDGDLAYKLTHPKHEVEKVYIARIKGVMDSETIKSLESGVEIDGRKTAPARVSVVKDWGGSMSVRLVIHEGRNRQVRKMLEAVGCRCMALKRVATGRLFLGDLPKGRHRFLTAAEINYLKNLTKG